MRRLILTALLAGAALAPAAAHAVPDGGSELVSRPTGFGQLPFDGVSYATVGPHAMSADGCKVVFASSNDVLSTLDVDAQQNIFLVDRCAAGQPVTLVSTTGSSSPADGWSSSPSISADGTRVAFSTSARNLLPPGATIAVGIVVKDLPSGDVILASRSNGTGGKPAESYGGVISGDGKVVAFEAVNEVEAANAKATSDELYVRYLAGGQTVMASAKGAVPAGLSGGFDISNDGSWIVLGSAAALVAGDGDGADDAYLAAVTPAGAVTQRLVSGSQMPREMAISGDGQKVAFADDRVWVANCATDPCGAPAQVDGAPAGSGQRIFGLDFPAAPAAAEVVSWTTNRALLPADTNAFGDLYAASLPPTPHVVLPFGTTPGGTGGGVVNGDLSVVVAESRSLDLPGTDGVQPQVFARSNGETALLSQPAGEPARRNEADRSMVAPGGISQNGRLVAMETLNPALGAPLRPDTRRRVAQIAVRDVLTGVTSLVSAGSDGAPGDDASYTPHVDASGSRIAFSSKAANLAPGLTAPGVEHVYVRDLATGATQLVDRKADGSGVSGGADVPDISNDGTKVAFISASPDLPAGGTYRHAYVVDLATGAITLVDQTAAGQPGDASADEVVLDDDGSRAAFTTSASNLGAAGGGTKVFLKDLSSGEVAYVSVPESGTPDQDARGVSIDAAGARVAWQESNATFGYGSDGRSHIFVRNVPEGTTTLASVGGGPTGSDDFGGELDASGSRLAFISGSENVPPYGFWPYVRDLGAGVTVPLLLPDSSYSAGAIALSPDGICAVFSSNAPDLTAEHVSPDYSQVYLRAVGGACSSRPDAGQPGAVGGAGADSTAPVISGLRMTRTRFAVRKRASAFVFRLSEDSRASVSIARCVKLRKRTCRRYRVVATLTRAHAKQGPNRIAFSGRIGKRKLKPGRYRATVGAVDAAGNRAVPRRVRFRIVRARAHR